MQRRATRHVDPDATPYDIVHEPLAGVTDHGPTFVVETAEGEIMRVRANDPEGLHVGFLEDEEDIEVANVVELGAGFWDIHSRDLCHIVAVERRGRKDNRGDWMGDGHGPSGSLYVVLKYMKDNEESMNTYRAPTYGLPDRFGSGTLRRRKLGDFKAEVSHGKRPTGDDTYIRQRKFADPSGLPP